MTRTIELELELDSSELEHQDLLRDRVWIGEEELQGIRVEVLDSEEGHGFGVAEVVTVLVTIGTGITTQLAVQGIKQAVKGLIRRARTKGDESDGSSEGLTRLVDESAIDAAPSSGVSETTSTRPAE